jgi:uncharacterized membrane protein YphA (DoxX/SURF4 family)
VNGLHLVRAALALVWLYQGFWCKLLGFAPHQENVVQAVPFFSAPTAHLILLALGMTETLLAVWLLAGWRPRWAAFAQIALLVGMNTAGLIFGRAFIPDPAGMVVQNLAFIMLILIAAGEVRIAAPTTPS